MAADKGDDNADANPPTKDKAPTPPVDPVTAALQEAQKQAEARQAIAEARSGTAEALLPELPDTLGATLDAAGAGTSFGTVNCYRAALKCTESIAAEVADKLQGKPVWVASGPGAPSPMAVRATVDNAISHLTTRLTAAMALLASPVDSVPGTAQTGGRQEVVGTGAAVSLLSAGIPLLTRLFSSKVTLKSGTTDLDDAAVIDLMTHALLDRGCSVVRPDPNAPLDPRLAAATGEIRRLVDELRRALWRTTAQAQDESASAAGPTAERDLLEARITAFVEGSGKDFQPDVTPDIQRVVALADDIAVREKAKAILDARLADGLALVEAAQQALEALYAVDADGFSALGYASFAERFAGEEAWARLEVSGVSAGVDAQYHDRTVRSDFAVHTGSATVTYRLHDGTGAVVAANTYVDKASCRVDLASGEVDWVT